MSETKKVLLTDYSPQERDFDFRCGNSTFSQDIWDFKGFIEAPQWNDKKFQLNFTVFDSFDIKQTIKLYIASELLLNGYNSVRRKLDAFSQFRTYLKAPQGLQIKSFKSFDRNTLRSYFEYLTTEAENPKGDPLSSVSIKKSAQVVKELLIRGAIREWDVFEDSTHVEELYQVMIIKNKKLKTEFGKTDKILPSQDVITNLIKRSEEVLDSVSDEVLTGASILLTTQLGCRISEVLSIKENCLSIINGETYITYKTSKTQKQAIDVTVPANELVVKAIQKLLAFSEERRKRSKSPYLFLVLERFRKGHPIRVASHSNWSKNRLNPFIKKHDLRDDKGELLKLTHHYFRHIFATYALKSGMRIHNVAEMMNHKSIMMTETYDHEKHLKQEVIKDILTGKKPIASTNNLVLERINSNENPFKGMTTNQVEKLRRTLKVEILPHGMCFHHPLRGEPCHQDTICLTCEFFIATQEHIDVYYKRLEKIEEELANVGSDNGIYATKLRFQGGKLQYLISEIERKAAVMEYNKSLQEVAVDIDG